MLYCSSILTPTDIRDKICAKHTIDQSQTLLLYKPPDTNKPFTDIDQPVGNTGHRTGSANTSPHGL